MLLHLWQRGRMRLIGMWRGLLGQQLALSFSHLDFSEENTLDNFGLTMPIKMSGGNMAWGFSVSRLSYPDQERRGLNREKEGSFGAQDFGCRRVLGVSMEPVSTGNPSQNDQTRNRIRIRQWLGC